MLYFNALLLLSPSVSQNSPTPLLPPVVSNMNVVLCALLDCSDSLSPSLLGFVNALKLAVGSFPVCYSGYFVSSAEHHFLTVFIAAFEYFV